MWPFSLLRKRKAEPLAPSYIDTRYDKLVRDNIIDIITADGGIPDYMLVAGTPLYTRALVHKGVEEMNELLRAVLGGTQEEIDEEFADVMTVLQALRPHVCSRTFSQLRRIAECKLQEKGGFDKGVFLKSVRRAVN